MSRYIQMWTVDGNYIGTAEIRDAIEKEVLSYNPTEMAALFSRLIVTMLDSGVITVKQAGNIFEQDWS